MKKNIEEIREDIFNDIATNYSNYDFMIYITHCIEKWNEVENKNNTIDRIIDAVCENHNIKREELIRSNSLLDYYIRGGIFYVIRNKMKLSYSEISIIFKRTKSYVFKIINDIDGLLKMKANTYNSLLKDVITLAESEISKNK